MAYAGGWTGLGAICVLGLLVSVVELLSALLYCRDEEYDRGKLKKVRNKEKITGFEVNPFQAIANSSSKQRLPAEVRSHNLHD